MKIFLFMDAPMLPTGYGSTCRLTASELIKRGHEVFAANFNVYQNPPDVINYFEMKVFPNTALNRNPDATYGDLDLLKEIEAKWKPDIYFFHNDSYRYSYLQHASAEILRKSVFWLPFEGEHKDHLGITLFSKCAATRFVTNHALKMHENELKGKDIGAISHAVHHDMQPFQDKRAAKRDKQLGIEDKFVVVRVDRHQPRKYWKLTLEAFAKFAKDKQDVFLVAKCHPRDHTMWDEKEKKGEDLEQLARDLGIFEKVKFDDYFFNEGAMAHCFYHPADVFLTTTSGEGFGLTPAEAMACGIPVIYPNTPVLPEVIGAGGIVCKIRPEKEYYDKLNVYHNIADTDDIAEKLDQAYDDWKRNGSAKLKEIGAAGRKIASEKYSIKAVYDEWDSVLASVSSRNELVSIVTVLYNVSGKEYIYGDECTIDKLHKTINQYVTTPYEWIIVDNGSPQKEVTRSWMEAVAKENPRIRPLYLDCNLGYAGGNNAGLVASVGNWACLLNPDSQVLDHKEKGIPDDCLRTLIDGFKPGNKVGIVGMEIKDRDDVLDGLSFPYFGVAMISRECLDAIKTKDGKYFDEQFWPAYYEDADLTLRARGKGYEIKSVNTAFWHKSGGTNQHMIGAANNPNAKKLLVELDHLEKTKPGMMDFDRKRGEISSHGMQGVIDGNINYLRRKWGQEARSKIKVVWHTDIGAAVGFSQIAEGLTQELHRMGFDVYIHDWSNGARAEDPLVKELIEKTKKAKLAGVDLSDAINIVCWLMETFSDVNASFKVGISFCESTRIRPSYLHHCNKCDRILTFSEFCKKVQIDSGYTVPIDVITPGVHETYVKTPVQKRISTKKKFSFLAVGVSQERKDFGKMVAAFCDAFPKGKSQLGINNDDVELVVKSNNFGELGWITTQGWSKRANIRTVFTGQSERAERPNYTMAEMYDLFASADCLVHPSHGEGIGMPILEGAACGLPVIFTNWSSPAEYLDESNSYPLKLSAYPAFVQAYPGAPGSENNENGMWANADPEHLKYLMYQVVKNRDEANAKGARAAETIRSKFTWKSSAKKLWPLIFEWEAARPKGTAKAIDFDPLTFVKPTLAPVAKGDRVMLDIVTRDRHGYLAALLTSLWSQTFKEWDATVIVDDADESILADHLIKSMTRRLEHEGHAIKFIRGHRQGPHVGHDRTLNMTPDRYKIICRIDDDIIVRPDYLQKMFDVFLSSPNAAAVGGVYLDPKRTDAEQTAPPEFAKDLMYAGKIDPNVMWPYVCHYPPGTAPRSVEHLYSSFMYRSEVAKAVGGYCLELSPIGFREESDFSYRFHLAGFDLFVQHEAVGYHFCAPAGGTRSNEINDRQRLVETDHGVYERRLRRWQKRREERLQRDRKPVAEQDAQQAPVLSPSGPGAKVLCVINCGADIDSAAAAVERYSAFCSELYLTTRDEALRDAFVGHPKVCMVAVTPDEVSMLTKQMLSEGDHEYIMTVTDAMRFVGDPVSLVGDKYDDYVFEVFSTYLPGKYNGVVFVESGDEIVIGPELENRCLITRKRQDKTPDVSRIYYADMMVLDDVKQRPVDGKSALGNPLMRLREAETSRWRKICFHQYPEGKLKQPLFMDVIPQKNPGMISIVIPTPGRRFLLKQCIDSIYSHTSTPFEIIVIDNGSNDGTKEYLEEESKKRSNLTFVRSDVNLGYQKGINLGVSRAKGDYLMLFNDDAKVLGLLPDGRDWLKTFMDELESDPKIGIVGPHEGMSPTLNIQMLFFWCVLLRRKTWDEIGPLDDVTFFNYGGDDDYCMRLSKAGYKIGVKFIDRLRHLMTCVPDHVKKPQLEESQQKLARKYNLQTYERHL